MRAIFVNHCHPDCPHVCGTRAREFANALARQGHQIVLLTETLACDDPALDPAALNDMLRSHDWSAPFRLPVRPEPAPMLRVLRAANTAAPLRMAIIAYQYCIKGGVFTDWSDASRAYWPGLAQWFRPDVVWGIFGNTDAWTIAQGIARMAACRWVRDIKDNWTAFTPAALRPMLARRFSDAAGTTALSRIYAEGASPWLGAETKVIYSGHGATEADYPQPPEVFSLCLVGGLYDEVSLTILVEGLARFLGGGDRGPVRLTYMGTDPEKAHAAFAPLAGRIDLKIRGQLPFADYWSLVRSAHLNLYARTRHADSWHHKLVELLGARRPILCCPAESEEARQLVSQVRGMLYEGRDVAAVSAVLNESWQKRLIFQSIGDASALARLSWDARATDLASALAVVSN